MKKNKARCSGCGCLIDGVPVNSVCPSCRKAVIRVEDEVIDLEKIKIESG